MGSTSSTRPMRILESPLLAGFPHGFTTRAGGVSDSPYDALNLGGLVGDDPVRVEENWRRLERATGLRFARVRQVHGARVVRTTEPCAPTEEADVVVSASAGVAAGRLLAAVGPSIGPCCYEVSEDLCARFRDEVDPAVVRAGARPRLDLWGANTRILSDAGLHADRIEVLGRCTSCERDLFYSHRRDAGRTGRHVAFIAPRAPTRGGRGRRATGRGRPAGRGAPAPPRERGALPQGRCARRPCGRRLDPTAPRPGGAGRPEGRA